MFYGFMMISYDLIYKGFHAYLYVYVFGWDMEQMYIVATGCI